MTIECIFIKYKLINKTLLECIVPSLYSVLNPGSSREHQVHPGRDGRGWICCPGGSDQERKGALLLQCGLHCDFRQSVDQPEEARAHLWNPGELLLHGGGTGRLQLWRRLGLWVG